MNRLAKKLEHACELRGLAQLRVLVQVATSEEETKSGVAPGAELEQLVGLILAECKRLHFAGLMTIGQEGDLGAFQVRPPHQRLRQARADLAAKFGLDELALELSMGMSADFEAAVREGSTAVRVGSAIFGARDYAQL